MKIGGSTIQHCKNCTILQQSMTCSVEQWTTTLKVQYSAIHNSNRHQSAHRRVAFSHFWGGCCDAKQSDAQQSSATQIKAEKGRESVKKTSRSPAKRRIAKPSDAQQSHATQSKMRKGRESVKKTSRSPRFLLLLSVRHASPSAGGGNDCANFRGELVQRGTAGVLGTRPGEDAKGCMILQTGGGSPSLAEKVSLFLSSHHVFLFRDANLHGEKRAQSFLHILYGLEQNI